MFTTGPSCPKNPCPGHISGVVSMAQYKKGVCYSDQDTSGYIQPTKIKCNIWVPHQLVDRIWDKITSNDDEAKTGIVFLLVPQVVALVTEAAGGTWTGLGGRIKAVAIPSHLAIVIFALKAWNLALGILCLLCLFVSVHCFGKRYSIWGVTCNAQVPPSVLVPLCIIFPLPQSKAAGL